MTQLPNSLSRIRLNQVPFHFTTVGAALACLMVSACGAEGMGDQVGEQTEFAETSEALQNGGAPTGLGDGGTVRIDVWNNGQWNQSCSGQVVARDSVLTAAHCFRGFGRPSGNRWAYVIWRQSDDGTWTNLTQTSASGWKRGSFELHPDYDGTQVAAPVAGDNGWRNHDAKHDVAVLTLDANLTGITRNDSVYLDNNSPRARDASFWGYSTSVLRQGLYDVTFNFSDGLYRSKPNVSDPRFCPGDSGGPLKRRDSLFEQDGIQIGIGSDFTNGCLTAGSTTRFTGVQPNISFITGAFSPHRCIDVTSLSTTGSVAVKRCW